MSENVHSGVLPWGIAAIGASAGGVEALMALLPDLVPEFPAPIVVALHLPPPQAHESRLPELLQRHARLRMKWAQQGEVPKPGVLYLAPQGRHTELADWGAFELLPPTGRPVPSINRLFTSVARACGSRAVGVVLSGCLSDGAAGSHRIIEAGGKLLFQDRSTALQYEMPWASLRTGAPGLVLPPRALAAALLATMAVPGASQWFQVREGNAYPSTAL